MNGLEILALVVIGLVAGALGGLLGIGGSIVMIPALTILFGRNMHLVEAAAMIVNVFISVPATASHQTAGAVRWKVVALMLPFGVVFILLGVASGNTVNGEILQRIFAIFLLYVIAVNVRRLVARGRNREIPVEHTPRWWRVGIVGSVVGYIAGLLGIGGGVVAVPMLQRVGGMALRDCIATSSAVICMTAAVGAIAKNLTLHVHADEIDTTLMGAPLLESVLIAACLAPSAFVGGYLGAKLTHTLPLIYVRIAFILLLLAASIRMLLP